MSNNCFPDMALLALAGTVVNVNGAGAKSGVHMHAGANSKREKRPLSADIIKKRTVVYVLLNG